jgi:hypothetical protein
MPAEEPRIDVTLAVIVSDFEDIRPLPEGTLARLVVVKTKWR